MRLLRARRSPTCVLGTLLVTSLLFLVVQLNLVPLFGGKEKGSVDSVHQSGKLEKKKNIQHEAISQFAKLMVKHRIAGFLIHRGILESILQFEGGSRFLDGYCVVLCQDSSSVQFGVISHVDISQEFLDRVKQARFTHLEVTGPDPRVRHLRPSKQHHIPLHHFFVYEEAYLVQLVVFYPRSDAFLWHGEIDWFQIPPKSGGALVQQHREGALLFGSKGEGAYDKMEFAKIKVDDIYLTVPKYPTRFLSQIPHSSFIECNYDRAADFISRHYGDGDVAGENFRSGARDILIAGAAVLDELGIPFWLSSGTCLSWFRECRIIGHSLDVDFGMRIGDYSVRLIPAMEMAGLMLVHQFGKKTDSFELSFVKDELKLDIFFFYPEGNTLWNGGTDTNTGEKYKYVFPQFDLCWTQFVGVKVRVPCPTLPYVEANYGSSWNTKVTAWNWKSSPPNVVPNGQWPKEEWAEVMQVFEIIEVEGR